jgi:hypothetical protein
VIAEIAMKTKHGAKQDEAGNQATQEIILQEPVIHQIYRQ